MRRTFCIALACLSLPLAACGGDDGDKGDTTASTTPSGTTAGASGPSAAAPSGGCRQVAQPKPERRRGKKPTAPLASRKQYELVFATNCGSFTITLDQHLAPKTTASLVALARAKFFDGTAFHRIVPDFVIQGGDPTGTGQGDPGYSTRDKPPSTASYTRGVVAMAKTGQEPPGTAGSQFFVVTAAEAPFPSPDYAIVGRVTDGLDTVERIGQLGGPDQRPTQPVVIDEVTVKES